MIYPVKIVGCVVDVHNLTMYKADGDTIVIPQGDARVRDLVAKLVPAFEAGGPQHYMLESLDLDDKNHFAESEKKMGGVVRFFKMVKSKAKELLDKFVEPVEPMVLGNKPAPVPVHTVAGELREPVMVEEAKPVLPPEEERPLTKSAAAVAEIMANAVPASTVAFSTPDVEGAEETTVIAVLEDNTVIPGCEVLVNQAQAVAEGIGSAIGMQNFLRRAGMIKRGHSVEDLLKFIQKGELPLADDGCVLVYKLLKRTSKEGVFVDCHSGNVKQRVGSLVHMDESMVDPNRSQDCSNGLHVARRDYLSNFGGNVCVLAKLAPEDVIAVPQYDARKLRAKAYHIIAELSVTDLGLVKQDKPMQDQVLLGNAIAGNHVGILEHVKITQSKGGGLVITPVADAVEGAPALDHSLTGSSLDHLPADEFDVEKNSVDARALALEVAKPVAPADSEQVTKIVEEANASYQAPPATPVEEPVKVQQAKQVSKTPAQKLVDAFTGSNSVTDALALWEYKKKSKKSWASLGVSVAVYDAVTVLLAKDTAEASQVKQSTKDTIERVLAADPTTAFTGSAAKPVTVKKAAPPFAKPTPAPVADPKPPVEKKMSRQEQMAHLVDLYNRNPDKQNAKEIVAFKQKTKKSWDVLGVTDGQFIKKITERAKL